MPTARCGRPSPSHAPRSRARAARGTLWSELDAPYEGARASLLLSRAYAMLGDEDSAHMEPDASRWEFQQLGAEPEVARLDALELTAPGSVAGAAGAGTFRQENLVSDQPGVATLTVPNLVNPWGMSRGANSPVWVSDNGADVSTLYRGDTAGAPGIDRAAGGEHPRWCSDRAGVQRHDRVRRAGHGQVGGVHLRR
jgi:hypothetical protein